MFQSIGFVGAGRVTRIMLNAWLRSGASLPPVVVFDESAEAVASLRAIFPAVQPASLSDVLGQDLVFLGLHPPVMAEMLPQMVPHLKAQSVWVSLAPRLRLPTLQQKLGGFARLARLNPNAPAWIGKGFNPIAFGPGLPEDARHELLALLAPLGEVPVVTDELIEACAVVSAMGPTYFWFQFEALRRLAEGFGMSPELARHALRSMLHGAVDVLFDSELSPAQVMDLVPVRPMAADEDGFRATLQQRVGGMHLKLTT